MTSSTATQTNRWLVSSIDHCIVGAWYHSLWVKVRLRLTLFWYKPPSFSCGNYALKILFGIRTTWFTYESRKGWIKTRSTQASFPPVTLKWAYLVQERPCYSCCKGLICINSVCVYCCRDGGAIISLCQALSQGRWAKNVGERWKSKRAINAVSPQLPLQHFSMCFSHYLECWNRLAGDGKN